MNFGIKIKKTFYHIILAVSLTRVLIPQEIWNWQNPLPLGNEMKNIFFIDSSTGWAVGNNGTLLKTNNGNTWEVIYIDTIRENLNSVYFIDKNIGWMTSAEPLYVEAGKIFKTENGGANWYLVYSTNNKMFNTFFVNDTIGWAVGNGLVIKTTNGGLSWQSQIANMAYQFNTCYFIDTLVGWAMGSVIYYTDDGGHNWQRINPGVEGRFWAIKFVDRMNGWILGKRAAFPNIPSILRSTDGGKSWYEHFSGGAQRLDLQFIDSLNGYLLDASNAIQKSCDGGFNWIPLHNFGSYNVIQKIHFIDISTGWAIGSNGTIFKTTNGGINWSEQTSGFRRNIKDIFFSDSLNGWLTTVQNSQIYRTTNGGESWVLSFYGGYFIENLHKIMFVNNSKGWVVGYRRTQPPPSEGGGVVMMTTNGGQNWISLGYPSWYDLYSVFFVDDFVGFASGGFGTLLKTNNGGISWSNISPTSEAIDEVFFIDSHTGWIACQNGDIFKTTNGGNSWSLSRAGQNSPLYALHFINSEVGWAGGKPGLIYTTNGGDTWNDYSISAGTIYDIAFDQNLGFAVGSNGILKSLDGGLSWIFYFLPSPEIRTVHLVHNKTGWLAGVNGTIIKYKLNDPASSGNEKHQAFQKNYSLHQNYPNPFNPSTKISWQSPVSSHQVLKVFDVLGREVATLVNEYREAGYHEVEFQLAVGNKQYASGIYFYQLRAGNYIATKKMVVVR